MDPAPSRRAELEGLDLQHVPVLSLDQLRLIRASNDYVDRPVAPDPDDRHAHRHAPPPLHPALPRSQSQHAHPSHLSRSSTISSSASRTSTASDQRLLAAPPPPRHAAAIRSQPKAGLKADAPPDKGEEAEPGRHAFICERCGRCKCAECRAPRPLPSCWACGRRCLCSAPVAVEYATCLCCVKGLFYHCSAQDDEDNCADRPCSCGPAHAGARWGAMAALALCLPCLCCYPPARLCLAACQRVHDRATRPGCRCSNTNTVRRKVSDPPPPAKATGKPL